MKTDLAPRRKNYKNRAAWLKARRSMIGASESAAILGFGYASQNAWTVYASKVGESTGESEEECERFECGHLAQSMILELTRRRTSLAVEDPGEFTIYRHPDYPWLGATLDGAVKPSRPSIVVEAKNVDAALLREWDDEPPLAFQIQVQHQMFVTGANLAIVAGLIGGNRFRYKEIPRSEPFIEQLIPKLEAFWQHVEQRIPPAVDDSYATTTALIRLHPNDNGETTVLPPEAAAWSVLLEKAKADKKDAEARELEYGNKIRAAIGDCTFGVLTDGSRYSWKTQNVSEHVVPARTQRVLRKAK